MDRPSTIYNIFGTFTMLFFLSYVGQPFLSDINCWTFTYMENRFLRLITKEVREFTWSMMDEAEKQLRKIWSGRQVK